MEFTQDASAVERAPIDRASKARSPINGSMEQSIADFLEAQVRSGLILAEPAQKP